MDGSEGSKTMVSHSFTLVVGTVMIQLSPPSEDPSSFKLTEPTWSMNTFMATILLAIRSIGVSGFGFEKHPAQTSETAGLTYWVTFGLVFTPPGPGLATTSVKVPSSALPKYWKTVLVEGDSKSRITTGAGPFGKAV